MPKVLILFTNNHALQFIKSLPNLNQRHAKRVEFLQNFTFIIKHTSGSSNNVDDDLSRINLDLQELQISALGFVELQKMYKGDVDIKEAYTSCQNIVSMNTTK